MMYYLAILLLIVNSATESDSNCPENVVCTSTLNPKSCKNGTYYFERIKSKNCCPGCERRQGHGEVCDDENRKCAPGLQCLENPQPPRDYDYYYNRGYSREKTCDFDKSQSCEYYKRKDVTYNKWKYWEPNCLPTGMYDKKQCKGDKVMGKCFCTNEKGVRIFGESPWSMAQNMTCECSRQAERLSSIRKDTSLHCDENGNFEALQCDNGICWCANERTGIPYTPVVPETMTRVLPCFEENNFGSQYLRQCDSARVQTERVIKILKNHGVKKIILPVVNCNYDGSYARLQKKGEKNYCAFRDGKEILPASNLIKDCNCAYDRYLAQLTENEFHFDCDDAGSYKGKQTIGNIKFQVDVDGCIFDEVEI